MNSHEPKRSEIRALKAKLAAGLRKRTATDLNDLLECMLRAAGLIPPPPQWTEEEAAKKEFYLFSPRGSTLPEAERIQELMEFRIRNYARYSVKPEIDTRRPPAEPEYPTNEENIESEAQIMIGAARALGVSPRDLPATLKARIVWSRRDSELYADPDSAELPTPEEVSEIATAIIAASFCSANINKAAQLAANEVCL